MNNIRQCPEAQAVLAGVSFGQLLPAFASATPETIVRRDDATLAAKMKA